jgi:hypothetical protein
MLQGADVIQRDACVEAGHQFAKTFGEALAAHQ